MPFLPCKVQHTEPLLQKEPKETIKEKTQTFLNQGQKLYFEEMPLYVHYVK